MSEIEIVVFSLIGCTFEEKISRQYPVRHGEDFFLHKKYMRYSRVKMKQRGRGQADQESLPHLPQSLWLHS